MTKYNMNRRAAWLGAILGMIVAVTPTFAADYTEKFEKTYHVAPNVRVALSNVNGGVEVTAWDRNEVQVLATKHANTQEKLARLKIDVQASNDSVVVKTKLPEGTNNNPGSVEYEIRVPRGAKLDKIDTVNGSVEVSGIRGAVKISSVNGKVTGRGLVGDIELSTVNGMVDCEVVDLAGAHNVKLSTVNGSVQLSMPRDANAHLTASTVHGRISSDFSLPIKSGFVGSNLDTMIGSGNTQVELSSVNGGISIHGGAKGL
jgi:DUF4097 and DUF4098 domain-containing protein YvlB